MISESKRQCRRCEVCSESISFQANNHHHHHHHHHHQDFLTTTNNNNNTTTLDSMVPSSPRIDDSLHESSVKHCRCPICSVSYVCREELEQHLVQRHKARLRSCQFCGLKFALKKNLEDHLQRHRGSKVSLYGFVFNIINIKHYNIILYLLCILLVLTA
jgi:hypothetical protein